MMVDSPAVPVDGFLGTERPRDLAPVPQRQKWSWRLAWPVAWMGFKPELRRLAKEPAWRSRFWLFHAPAPQEKAKHAADANPRGASHMIYP